MGYDVFLFTKETKEKQVQSKDPGFYEDEKGLEPFTPAQFEKLKHKLGLYKFQLEQETRSGLRFSHQSFNVRALLTQRGLYFSAKFDQDSIFEAGMTASEMSDTGEFQKFDPQSGGWEEF